MACDLCDIINEKKTAVLYEDELAILFLHQRPAAIGHMVIAPKQHFPIMEQCPDSLMNHLGKLVNKASMAVFESLNIQGTNILINNGISAGQSHNHFSINIIPRTQDDNVSFEWKPRQLGEEEMSTVELKIKENSKSVGIVEKEAPKPVVVDSTPELITERVPSSIGKDEEEENYLVKQLRRVP